MGGVSVREIKKGSGVFYIFITVNGRRKSRKIGPKKLAEEVAAKIRARMLTGDLQIEDRKKVFTLQEYALLWIENYIRPTRKPGTYRRYEEILRLYVVPELGKKPLDKITRADVKRFLLGLHKAGSSRSTIALCRDVMSGALGQAIDDELINVNPVSGVLKSLKLERAKRIPVEPMTFDEVRLFLDTCKKYVPQHYPFFLTACRTGMRLGELLALEWRDIDFNGYFIRVERSFKGGRVSGTKTGKVRRVDMSDQLHDELKRLHHVRQQDALQVVELVAEGLGELVRGLVDPPGARLVQGPDPDPPRSPHGGVEVREGEAPLGEGPDLTGLLQHGVGQDEDTGRITFLGQKLPFNPDKGEWIFVDAVPRQDLFLFHRSRWANVRIAQIRSPTM